MNAEEEDVHVIQRQSLRPSRTLSVDCPLLTLSCPAALTVLRVLSPYHMPSPCQLQEQGRAECSQQPHSHEGDCPMCAFLPLVFVRSKEMPSNDGVVFCTACCAVLGLQHTDPSLEMASGHR